MGRGFGCFNFLNESGVFTTADRSINFLSMRIHLATLLVTAALIDGNAFAK
jgi:hypothetical protein